MLGLVLLAVPCCIVDESKTVWVGFKEVRNAKLS